MSISPLDGRYRQALIPFARYIEQNALTYYRILVETEYMIALSDLPQLDIRAFTDDEKAFLRTLPETGRQEEEIIGGIEQTGYYGIPATKHDVKAIEYYIKEKMKATTLADCLEWVHFALTSEDVNNISYSLILSDCVGNALAPTLEKIVAACESIAGQCSKMPMLARTHGQPASPTTLGKEFKNSAVRIERQLHLLKKQTILAKLNGATGNYNAHIVAYPEVDWLSFSQKFISRFNEGRMIRLEPNLWTTQIEPHDSYVELFDTLHRINTILIGYNQNLWHYISDEWLVQRPVPEETGSSTMPHKVNPIQFENSEGRLGVANALLRFFSEKLPISRLQRDLSDSTVEREFCSALSDCFLGYASILSGLQRIAPNEKAMLASLQKHPEVVAEAYQIILRREGFFAPYEALKTLTRGKKITLMDLHSFVDALDIPDSIKNEMKRISPENYIGLAALLAEKK